MWRVREVQVANVKGKRKSAGPQPRHFFEITGLAGTREKVMAARRLRT